MRELLISRLEVSPEDFEKATDELTKAGVKVVIDKPVVRPDR